MSTLKPKAKSKKPGKSSRSDSRNPDLSELRKPIMISVSSLKEVAKLLETGTPEIKSLLTYEVNLLYECRICRSIFRSLVNLLSHKRVFCKERVNVSSENKSQDDTAKSSNITPDDLQCPELDQINLNLLINPSSNDRILRSQAPGKANKKDLTSVLDMLQKKQVENLGESTKQKEKQIKETDCDQVVLQILNSKRAAFQTLVEPNSSQDDLMKNQIIELDNILNQDTVVLGPDGQIEKSDSPVHFYTNEDQEINKLTCDICSYTFATQKTLNSHIEIKHASVRDCYMCPCHPCQDSFTSLASVKRHLTNVHRKIGQELKNLGQQAEKRTLRSKVHPVLVNKKHRKPENRGNSIDESQEWIEHLGRRVEMHNCISCKEKFDEKLELLRHAQTCLGQSDERISSKIALDNVIVCEGDNDMDENLMAPSSSETSEIVFHNVSDDNHGFSQIDISSTVSLRKEGINDLSIRVQGVSSLSEEDWRKLPEWSSENGESTVNPTNDAFTREVILNIERPNRPLITDSRVLNAPEIVYPSVDNLKKRKFSSLSEVNEPVVQGGKFIKVSSQESASEKAESERANTQLFSERLASISDHTKLECIACRKSFTNITSLNRHMENHIKINRYRCNKCDFKSINRSDCVGHCNKVHNAMNNRHVLNEMISEISQDQLILSREMITVKPSSLNLHEIRRVSSNADCRLENMNLVTDVLQKHSQLLPNPVRNWKDANTSGIISDSVNPSDTDTETEDREAVYRRIDSNPNLNEMIREVVMGTNSNIHPPGPNSNHNGVNQFLVQNNNLERGKEKKLDGYSLPIGEIDLNTNYPDEEDEISSEFYPRTRSNSRASKRSRSRTASGNESRMETRSSSRLGKKLDSDDEDEITRELFEGDVSDYSFRGRSSSRISKRSDSRMETRSESRMMTRSQSRLGNKIRSGEEEKNEDCWEGYSKDMSSEGKSRRSKSQTAKSKKETRGRSVSRQSRGRPRGRRSAPAKTNHNSREIEERRGSFSSENSQVQRPIRIRVKHVDKDFIYDLEDDTFQKGRSYSPNGSSEKKSSNGNQFAQVSSVSSNEKKQLFVDNTGDLDIEDSELFFRGFPRQPEIVNVE